MAPQRPYGDLVLENLQAAAVATGEDGRIAVWNPEAGAVFGVAAGDALGRPAGEVLTADLGQGIERVARALAGGETLEVEARIVRDGRARDLQVQVTPVSGGTPPLRAIAIAFDVTGRRRAEARLEAQYAAARVLATSRDLDEATPRLLEEIGTAIGWDVGDLWVVDEDARVLRFVDAWHRGAVDVAAFVEASREITLAPGEGLPGRVWQQGAPTWIDDVQGDTNFPRVAIAAKAGLHSAFSFPVRLGERMVGVMSFLSRAVVPEDPQLLKAMDAIGAHTGQFIQSTLAAERVRASEARKSAMVEASLDAVISIDHQGVVVEFNPAAEEMFGFRREEIIGREMAELIVPEHLRDAHRKALARYLETGEARILGKRLELVGLRRDGSPFPIEVAIGRIDLPGPPTFTGFVRDITEQKAAEAALLEGERRLQQALEAGRMGAWEWDVQRGTVTWSPSLERLHGLEEGSFGGTFEAFKQDIHPDDGDYMLRSIERAVHAGEPYHVEYRIVRPDGTQRWVDAIGEVRRDAEGNPIRMHGVCMDVTERREAEEVRARLLEGEQAARAQAEQAQRRLTFLAEASRILGSSLNYEKTLSKIAGLAVPQIADWCSIDVPDGTEIRQVALAHADPDKVRWARELREKYPPSVDGPEGVSMVLRTGEPALYPEIPEELIERVARDEQHLRIIRELNLRSAMVVPLNARGRTLGAITFVSSTSGRAFGREDLNLARDLADRAAVAIDNARLYEERSYIARTLQRSLLPASIPEIPGVEVAARYRPAGEGNQVGGDFYDVFQRAEDDWIVLVGDVCGKGPDAAALTGLARHTLRAVAIDEPRADAVLAHLNEAILREETDRFCTVSYARLRRGPDGRVTATVACGGHPLPHVLRADGTIEEVGSFGTLIGLFPDIEVEERTVELGPADALVLYTDGVIEDRGEDAVAEVRSVRELLADCPAPVSAEAVADHIERQVDALNPDGPQDDVAIVVARVAP